jgi:hypothetical protein
MTKWLHTFPGATFIFFDHILSKSFIVAFLLFIKLQTVYMILVSQTTYLIN